MIQGKIEEYIRPTLLSMGYELWGCQYLPQGKYAVLRVFIDKDDGIGIEDCEKVSHQISALLDVEDPISGQYSLEVSSPGIPRPLFYSYQYQRYIGHKAEIKLIKSVHDKRRVQGVILAVNDQSVTLETAEGAVEYQFSNIVKAYLI